MRLRVRAVLPHLRGRILDVGCGPGPLVERLPYGCEYIGIDAGEGAVAKLRNRYPSHQFFKLDIQEELPPTDRPVETITMMAVIEHLQRPLDFLELYLPLLEDGGRIIITTPTPAGEKVHDLLRKLRLARSEVGVVHQHIYRLSELESMLREQGLAVTVARTFEFGMNQLVIGMKKSR